MVPRRNRHAAWRIASTLGFCVLAVFGPATAAHADASSPEARYAADGSYADSTGNHPPATPAGGVTFVPGVTGASGDQAFHFDGSGSVATDGGVGTFGMAPFDVSFNVQTTQTGVVDLVSKRAVCNYGTFFDIRLNGSGQLVGEIDGVNASDYTVIFDGVVNDGAWHRVTFRRTTTDLRFIVDGFTSNIVPLNGNPNLSMTTPVQLAGGPCVGVDGTQRLVGNLDNVSFSLGGPPPVVPEASTLVLLPATGVLVGGAFLALRRRRRASRTTVTA